MIETSVIILTYNAPEYVRETIETLNEVTPKEIRERLEIIVWDNASDEPTRKVLKELFERKYIDKMELSENNLMFAGGNNAGVRLAALESRCYLLLNSDVSIKDPRWYCNLRKQNKVFGGKYAVVSYGCCYDSPRRVDGYCYLIDRELYDQYPLDEQFQWWWGVTKQQANVLAAGGKILGYHSHDNMLVHYGGKSGVDLSKVKGNDTDKKEILSWFDKSTGAMDFRLSPGKSAIAYWMRKIIVRLKRI